MKLLKVIKLFIWRHSRIKIKYPKKYKKSDYNIALSVSNENIKRLANLQRDLKEKTGKYFDLCECYDLHALAKSYEYNKIKKYIK